MKKTNAIRWLDRFHFPYELLPYTYDPEHLDVEHIAASNNLDAAQVFKTLVCIGDKTGPVVAVIPGNKQLVLKSFAQLSGNKKVAMAPMKDLQILTGYIRGGCSPLGMKKKFPVYIDRAATELACVYVNAGTRGLLFGMAPEDLATVAEGAFGEIAE